MDIELCREFINDPKYAEVRDYFLSAFKYIDHELDKILNDDTNPYSNYEEHEWLLDTLENAGECTVRCIDLLERAYYD